MSAYNGDLIPVEAVTKLRQKHPGTIRVAEENRGTTVQVEQRQYQGGRGEQEHNRSGRTEAVLGWLRRTGAQPFR